MIHIGTLLRAELYSDYTGKSSVATVYNANKVKHPGKLIVTNGHWWDPSPKLCGNYKVDGKIISQQYDPALNLVWSGYGRTIYSYLLLWFADEGGTD